MTTTPKLRVIPGGRRCPICGKQAEQKFRPFCSKRCADIDMGRWLKGVYAVPGEELPQDAEADGEEPEKPR